MPETRRMREIARLALDHASRVNPVVKVVRTAAEALSDRSGPSLKGHNIAVVSPNEVSEQVEGPASEDSPANEHVPGATVTPVVLTNVSPDLPKALGSVESLLATPQSALVTPPQIMAMKLLIAYNANTVFEFMEDYEDALEDMGLDTGNPYDLRQYAVNGILPGGEFV